MRSFKPAAVLCAVSMAGLGVANASAGPVKYTVTPLGQLGEGDVIPNGINDLGQVVGISRPEAFLYSQGVMKGLGMLPGHEESWAKAINNSGVAVGYSALDDDFGVRAVKWEKGVITDLGDLGVGESSALALNNAGVIVGRSEVAPTVSHAFIWQDGVMTDLGTLGGEDSDANGINNAGIVVGGSEDAGGFSKPFVWKGAGLIELPLLPGDTAGAASAINEGGHIVGFSSGIDSGKRAVMWVGDEIVDLGTLGISASANALNNLEQVVGGSLLAPNQPRAFLWEDGVMYDLNDLLLDFEGVLSSAVGINDAGQIVAFGNADADFQSEGFLLSPVPEPSTGLVSFLLCTFLLRRSRKIRPISEGERHA